jgi:hypothetical protein
MELRLLAGFSFLNFESDKQNGQSIEHLDAFVMGED